jgi:hydrogenase expression/formation protein HypE
MEEQVLARIERLRRRPQLTETRITLAHGSGGKATHTLIEALFLEEFQHPLLARPTIRRSLHWTGNRACNSPSPPIPLW